MGYRLGAKIEGDEEKKMMYCKFRACKHNEKEVCGKYETLEEMMEDFKKGGGCAFTWFFSEQIPETLKELHRRRII